jgi:hydrogenase expression/formation protein HypD
VITGFEPLDILQGIWMLVKQIEEGRSSVEIQYRRIVSEEGNPIALQKWMKFSKEMGQSGGWTEGLGVTMGTQKRSRRVSIR